MPGGATCPTCKNSDALSATEPSVDWNSIWAPLSIIIIMLTLRFFIMGSTRAMKELPTVASEDEASDEEDSFCVSCNHEFRDMEALNKHLILSPVHNWCFICSRHFSTAASLAQHQASVVHKSRDFKCLFCMSCFKSPSGVAHHVESGCHKITRHHVTAAVQSANIVPNISTRRTTGPPTVPNTTRLFATQASFDGKAYKCYLCSKSCRTLDSLDAHLNSAAHDNTEFKCPKCKREFKVVSGFVQHLESQCCGLAETAQVEGFFNNLSGQGSRSLKF